MLKKLQICSQIYHSPELHYNCHTEIITKKVTLPTSVPQMVFIGLKGSESLIVQERIKEKRTRSSRLGASKTVPNGRYSSLSFTSMTVAAHDCPVHCIYLTW